MVDTVEEYDVCQDDYDIYVYQGEDWSMTFTLEDENGSPEDLTGYTAFLQARESENGPALVDLSVANGGVIISIPTGEITFVMTKAQTAALDFSRARYDWFTRTSSGDVPQTKGYFNVTRRMTRIP